MAFKILFLILLFITLIFSSGHVIACSLGPISVQKSLEVRDVIFHGKLEACISQEEYSYQKYKVYQLWKGSIQREYKVWVSECPQEFLKEMIGREFLVYADKHQEFKELISIQSDTFCGNRTTMLPSAFMRGADRLISKMMGNEDPFDFKQLGTPIHKF